MNGMADIPKNKTKKYFTDRGKRMLPELWREIAFIGKVSRKIGTQLQKPTKLM